MDFKETKMPKILLFGSGFVAQPCFEYLLRRDDNLVTVASRRIENAHKLIDTVKNDKSKFSRVNALSIDVSNKEALEALVEKHDLAISLIPYTQHALILDACVKYKKHMVTTSYINPNMAKYAKAAEEAGITCFNEVGVDPGIDNLYAVKTIHDIKEQGGLVETFLSYCGGLPAPEASNNPLGYKFSWSSRGVLLALRNSAKYLQDGKVVEVTGSQLMDIAKPIYIYPAFAFEGYPNRDSTPYSEKYNIPEVKNLIRGTLRYQGFPTFVKVLNCLGFLDEEPKAYLSGAGSSVTWPFILGNILGLDKSSYNDNEKLISAISKKINLENLGSKEDQQRIIDSFKWLGLLDNSSPVHANRENLLDTFCATLEAKMQYGPGERDMVMLQNRFEVVYPKENNRKETRLVTGLWFGEPNGPSAMALTVGVPCAITVQLILDGVIKRRGILAPLDYELVKPILEVLEKEGIKMDTEIY